MLFGQSVFQSVLDRLDAEAETEPADGEVCASLPRIHGLKAGFAAAVREGVSAPSARLGEAYFDNMEFDQTGFGSLHAETISDRTVPSDEAPAAARLMKERLGRITEEQVANELAISAADTLQSLQDKRRAFAKQNHPDAIPLPFREQATIRMKIANSLIDQAVRRLGVAVMLSR
jgi:hypothetical protein